MKPKIKLKVEKMKVEKVKDTMPDFHEGTGPSKTVILGLKIDEFFVSFGKYYFGPEMDSYYADKYKKLERFIDECVRRLAS